MASGSSADVVVIGAGVIGCSVAYYLARAGARVQVVERGEIGREASWASAGMISAPPFSDDPTGRFYRAGAALFPEFEAAIRAETGIEIGYRRCGSLHLCRRPEEWSHWEQEHAALAAIGDPVELWTAADVRDRAPGLASDVIGALFHPDAAQVRPPWLVRALAAGAARAGARFRTGEPVVGFARAGETDGPPPCVTGVVTVRETIPCGTVVVAGGAWSGEIGRALGVPFAMEPVRGQIVLLEATPPRLSPLVFDGDFYLTPRADGKVLLGSTVEFAGFDRGTTPEGVEGLLRKGLDAAPGLRGSRFVTAWAGLRPYAGRDAPLLGPLPGREEVVLATGHFRTGISPSLITGRLIADWITTRRTEIPLAPFLPG
jgi:glycine oxidase